MTEITFADVDLFFEELEEKNKDCPEFCRRHIQLVREQVASLQIINNWVEQLEGNPRLLSILRETFFLADKLRLLSVLARASVLLDKLLRFAKL